MVADEGAPPKLALRQRPSASALDLGRLADEVEDAAEEFRREDGSDGYFLCFFVMFGWRRRRAVLDGSYGWSWMSRVLLVYML